VEEKTELRMKWYYGLYSVSKGKLLKTMNWGRKGMSRARFSKMILVVTGKLNWSWRKRKLEASQLPRRLSERRKWSNKSSHYNCEDRYKCITAGIELKKKKIVHILPQIKPEV